MANVDPNVVIHELAIKLGQKDVELTMTNIALRDTEQLLADANAVIAKHGMAEPSPDGQ